MIRLKSYILIPKSKLGFTMVELLLVITLLAVLATAIMILVNPVTQFERTRDVQRKNDLAQIARALEQYYNDFNAYPVSSGSPNYHILDASHAWGNAWPPYMDVLPKDPKTSQRYIYTSDGQSYTIYTHLERGGQDPQACNTSGTDCPAVPEANLCNNGGSALSCSFGVSSPNISP